MPTQTKDEALKTFAHDVKSLITSVHAYNQLLQRRLKIIKDQSALKYSSQMNNQMEKLIDLVQSFSLEKKGKSK